MGHDHTCRFLNLGIEPSPEHSAIACLELNGFTREDHYRRDIDCSKCKSNFKIAELAV